MSLSPCVLPIDPSMLANSQNPLLLQAMIDARNKINDENNDFLERLRKEMNDPEANAESPYGIHEEQQLDQIQENLLLLIERTVQEAIQQEKINPDRLGELLKDLNLPVKPAAPSEEDAEKQRRIKELLEKQQRQVEEINRANEAKLEEKRRAIEELRRQQEEQQKQKMKS